jgi:hypothetical protein
VQELHGRAGGNASYVGQHYILAQERNCDCEHHSRDIPQCCLLVRPCDHYVLPLTIAFFSKFQDTIAYLVLKDWKKSSLVSKTGKGLIDGAGQMWWNAAAGQEILDPASLRRPVLFALDGADKVTIDNIAMQNPANWFNWVTDSKYVTYTNIRLSALSANKNPPKNADGWE